MVVKVARRAFSYTRFSHPEQAKGGSKGRQDGKAEALCAKHGWTLDTSIDLHDDGLSAFRGKHKNKGALGVFLEAVRARIIPSGSVLIIENLDRLSREKLDDATDIVRELLRAGILIATCAPERVYDKDTLNTPLGAIEIIFEFYRAHGESVRKSGMLKHEWQKRRDNLTTKPVHHQRPAWVDVAWRMVEGKPVFDHFVLNEEAAATVRRIFTLVIEGESFMGIAAMFNKERVPCIAKPYQKKEGKPAPRPRQWNPTYVRLIVLGREVLGELQPGQRIESEDKETGRVVVKQVPIGKPVAGYYPRCVSEDIWLEAQRHVRKGKFAGGRRGDNVTSLLTGLMYDANDGGECKVHPTGKFQYVLNTGRKNGHQKGTAVVMRYDWLEAGLLRYLKELRTEDVVKTEDRGQQDEELSALSTKAARLEHSIEQHKSKMADGLEDDPDMNDLLVRMIKSKKETAARLDKLRGEMTGNAGMALGETKGIIDLMKDAQGEDLKKLRLRLKSKIRSLVASVWIFAVKEKRKTHSWVQVFLKSGTARYILVDEDGTASVIYEDDAAKLPRCRDLRVLKDLTEEDVADMFGGR